MVQYSSVDFIKTFWSVAETGKTLDSEILRILFSYYWEMFWSFHESI